MEVTLYRCARCGLRWVPEGDEIPGKCVRCWFRAMIPTEVTVMGRDVRVRVIREYGLETGLLDPKVRRGLERLDLGICEHGWITPHLCPSCNQAA